MRTLLCLFTGLIFGIWLSLSACAQTPSQTEIETRAKQIGRHLRCVVCQNQSIEESAAPLAGDMRKLVRKRLSAGDSDEQVMAYMQARYGDFVLLKPPVQRNTWILWFAPFLALGGAALTLLTAARKRLVTDDTSPLSRQEQEQLAKLRHEQVKKTEKGG